MICQLYDQKRPVLSFEVFPPKQDSQIETIYATLDHLTGLSPDFISVTYGAAGSGNAHRTAEIASAVRKRGVEALAHLTCVSTDRNQINTILDNLKEKNIDDILAMRGDLPAGSSLPLSKDYRYASDLIEDIAGRGDFCIGAACYPEGHIDCDDFSVSLDHLRLKQDAGANFLISQLFFENDLFWNFLEKARLKGITLPISAGVMPIMSRSQIERMIFLCGASLPSKIIRLLHRYEHSPADLEKAGVEYAIAQMEDLVRGGAEGVHIYTMNKPHVAALAINRLRK